MVFSLIPPTGRIFPVRDTSPVMATFWRAGVLVAKDSRAVTMVHPALGPSLGVAPWTETNAYLTPTEPSTPAQSQLKVIKDFRIARSSCDLHLRHMEVDVGSHEELVLRLFLHEERAGERVRNLSAFLHHVSQLPRELQRSVFGTVFPLRFPRSPQRGLDEQRRTACGGKQGEMMLYLQQGFPKWQNEKLMIN